MFAHVRTLLPIFSGVELAAPRAWKTNPYQYINIVGGRYKSLVCASPTYVVVRSIPNTVTITGQLCEPT